MKTQTIFILALLGVVAFSLGTEAQGSSAQLQSFMNKHRGCILYDQPCDPTGKTLKEKLPLLIRGCTIRGCPRGTPATLLNFIEKVKSVSPQDWNAVVQKYGH